MLKMLTFLAALAIPSAALACPAQPLPRTAQMPLPADGTQDVALFGAVVSHFVNVARCANGHTALSQNSALDQVASAYSRDMAWVGFFDHVSPVVGRETLADRLGPTGIPLRRIAENLGQAFVVDYQPGRQYAVVDAAECAFTYDFTTQSTDDITLLPRHSYASAADALVAGWLASPGHRRNLLDPTLTQHGAGFAVTQPETLCGRILATQILIQ